MKTDAVMLNFYQWCKTPSSAFSKKYQRQPPFLHVFGTALSDLQLCFVQLKTVAPSARYSTFKYPVTLKPELGVTRGHLPPLFQMWGYKQANISIGTY